MLNRSKWRVATGGQPDTYSEVPHESEIRSLLFIMHINDFPVICSGHVIIFAGIQIVSTCVGTIKLENSLQLA